MPTVMPFRAVKFNGEKIKDFSKVICPPYDVISAKERKMLKNMHPANIIRLELPEEGAGKSKYVNAAENLELFKKKGYLSFDSLRQFYVYEQAFSVFGIAYRRKGLFAAVKVEEPSKGMILPHEKTFSGPKEDRLMMMKTLKMNISPIFLIFNDRSKKIVGFINRYAKAKCAYQAKDVNGITHRLWHITDINTQKLIQKEFVAQKLYIADGHHRYETAWNYSKLQNKKDSYAGQYACNYVLSFICPMQEKGLVILPTHRLVNAKSSGELDTLKAGIAKYFDLQKAGSIGALYKKVNSTPRGSACFGFVSRGGLYLMRPSKNILAQFNLKNASLAYKKLDVTILHNTVLKGIAKESISYIKDYSEVLAEVKNNAYACGFILKGASMDDIIAVAKNGEVMPEKTTYFYPKLATGILMKNLEGEL